MQRRLFRTRRRSAWGLMLLLLIALLGVSIVGEPEPDAAALGGPPGQAETRSAQGPLEAADDGRAPRRGGGP
jgi:hypothetical protein